MVDLTLNKEHKHRAWYKIQRKNFLVSIASYLIPREEEYNAMGRFTTGDREADRQLSQQKEQVFLTIEKMINIFSDNGEFTFLHPEKDIPIIHLILQEHIDDIIEADRMHEQGLYFEEEEVIYQRRMDMIEIEAFAREIYVRAYRKEPPADSPFQKIKSLLSPFHQKEMVEKKRVMPGYQSSLKEFDYSSLRRRKQNGK